MKVIMTLLVRDEEDIIEHNLNYHLLKGVDYFIVMDNLSKDNTPDILDTFSRRGKALVLRQDQDIYDQGSWVTSMARRAYELGADWVINSDADEFWWPLQGDLKDLAEGAGPTADCLSVRRCDLPPLAGPEPTPGLPPQMRQIFREVVSFNANGVPLLPKVMHRAVPDVVVEQGNHAAKSASFRIPVRDAGAIIFHYPLRNYAQFERKIVNGGKAYERNTALPEHWGATWRRLYEKYKAGELRQIYDASTLAEADVPALIKAGKLVRDTRIRHCLGNPDTGSAS